MNLTYTPTIGGIFNGPLNPPGFFVTIGGTGSLNLAAGQDAFSTGGSDGGTTTISVPMIGTGQVILESSKQIFFNATNTYSGGTQFGFSGSTYTGIVNFNNSASFGTGPLTMTTFGAGGAMVAEGTLPITITNAFIGSAGNLNIVGNPAGVTFSGPWSLGGGLQGIGSGGTGNLLVISGPITGDVGFTKFNNSTLLLSGSNTYSGLMTVSAGTVQVGNSNALGLAVDSVTSGAVLDLNGTGNLNNAIILNGTGASSAGALVNSNISSAAVLVQGSSVVGGTVTAAGSGISSGATFTVSGGGGSGATASANLGVTSASFTVTPGTQLYTVAPTVTISGGGPVSLATATVPLAGTSPSVISSTITITAPGTGFSGTPTLTFGTGTKSGSGTLPTAVGNSTHYQLMGVKITNPGSGYTSAPTLALSSGTGTANALLASVNLATSSSIGGPGTITINSPIIGTGVLTKTGAGTLNLNGANTYSGGTTISSGGGLLNIGSASSLPAGAFTVAGNSTFDNTSGADLSVPNSFVQSGGSPTYIGSANNMTFNGAASISGANRTLTVSAGTLTLASGITQDSARTFTKAGAGTLSLLGVNAYTGNTTVNGGTLALGSAGSLGNSSNIIVAAGGTFDVSAISAFALSVTNGFAASGNASPATIVGGTTVDFGSRPVTLTFDGIDPALTIAQGTLLLNGNPFIINGTVLPAGSYNIIQQSTGSITSSGTFVASGTALGAGIGFITVSGGNVVLTIPTTPVFSALTASQPVVYGTPNISLSGNLSASGGTIFPALGETINVKINGVTQTTTINDATGDFAIVYTTPAVPVTGSPFTITYSYLGDSTLNAASDTSTTLTVTKAPLSITAGNQSKTYGQTVVFGAGSTNFGSVGLLNGQIIGTVTLAVSGTGGAAGAQVSGSPYTITPSAPIGGTFASANYSITFNTGSLTVIPATLTVTANDVSAPYGSTNIVFATTDTGFVNGEILGTSDVAGAAALTSVGTSADAGVYPITNSIGTLTSTNYTFSLVNGNLTVTNAVSTNVVVASTNSAAVGTPIVFTATITTLAPSAAVPTNMVQFLIDGLTNGAPISLTSGVASITNSTLTAGSHIIEVDYAGDTNVLGTTNIVGSTNTVSVTLVDATPVNITGITTLGDGTSQISFAGGANQTYLVQGATNLAPPVTWTTISTNTAGTNGLFQFNDVDSTNFPARFYRTAKP